MFFLGLKVLHLSAQHRVYCRGNNALWLAKAELLSAARVGESLLEYLEWSPVLEHLVGNPVVSGMVGMLEASSPRTWKAS